MCLCALGGVLASPALRSRGPTSAVRSVRVGLGCLPIQALLCFLCSARMSVVVDKTFNRIENHPLNKDQSQIAKKSYLFSLVSSRRIMYLKGIQLKDILNT